MRPSIALKSKRYAIRQVVERFSVVNPRIFFDSTALDADSENSDLDLLVDALPGTTLFDLGALQCELEELLGVRVEVLTPGDLPERFRDRVLAEAQPI